MRRLVVALIVFASPPATAQVAEPTQAPETTEESAEEPIAARAARRLPNPSESAPGEVPLTEPVAPVPPGAPAWSASASVLGGLSDAFYGKAVFVASARRGFGAFSVEAFGGPALSWPGPALALCASAATCGTPGAAQLGATPGQLTWLAGAGAVLRAGIGKLSVGGLEPSRFSLELGAGPAAVGTRTTIGTTSDHVSPGGRLTFGLAVALSPELAVRGELQGLGYVAQLRGSSSFQAQFLGGASLAWQPGAAR